MWLKYCIVLLDTLIILLLEILSNKLNILKPSRISVVFGFDEKEERLIYQDIADLGSYIWHLHKFYDTPKINSNNICMYGHEIIKFSYSSSKLSFCFRDIFK